MYSKRLLFMITIFKAQACNHDKNNCVYHNIGYYCAVCASTRQNSVKHSSLHDEWFHPVVVLMGKEEIDTAGIIIIILCNKKRQCISSFNNRMTKIKKKNYFIYPVHGSNKIEYKNHLIIIVVNSLLFIQFFKILDVFRFYRLKYQQYYIDRTLFLLILHLYCRKMCYY